LPRIDPDYSGVVIPPNIAPLNFKVLEPGSGYLVKIAAGTDNGIQIYSSKPAIRIPIKKWRRLLAQNKDRDFTIQVLVRGNSKTWTQYKPITNHIAPENIDAWLAYRLINPAYNTWTKLGIYQRHLESFTEKPILPNRVTDGNCMNCHNFQNQNPDNMVLHLRGGKASGTLIVHDGKPVKVNTKTDFNRAGAYPAWHPTEERIAFSVNNLTMFYHNTGEPRDVLDRSSDIIVYDIPSNTVTTTPAISDIGRMENFPWWSPDGCWLYFCSAPAMENYLYITESGSEDLAYSKILYDLVRIPYNPKTGDWGELETLISASETGKSVNIPRVSPDGRYVLICISDYGNFPIYLKSSDLYLYDLQTGTNRRLDINSDETDSYHTWSSNGRWFVFSSKRRNGFAARPYFSYFDDNGRAHKPFVMPQKDPEFYRTYIMTYNVPELMKDSVKPGPRELAKTAFNNRETRLAKLDPNVKPRQSNEESPYQNVTQRR
ncbi:PD40 domain-containing protein, partial [candidate division KSB1 bacterium]|nr:PD40 domain-containing protein [candidate division KSB1 bacterium]